MTTYNKCKHCGEKFKSNYQISNLKKNDIRNCFESCPKCGEQTLADNNTLFNE